MVPKYALKKEKLSQNEASLCGYCTRTKEDGTVG